MFSHSTVFSQQTPDAWLLPINQGHGTCAAGAYLIQGTVIGHDRAYSAVLTFSLVDGRHIDVDVLVTRKGSIQEMVQVPASIRAVKIRASASNASEAQQQVSVTLRRLSWLEYRFRQLRRVVPVFYRQTRQRRARAGLSPATLFTNLDYAYTVACRFRANSYMRSYADWHAEFYTVSPADVHAMQQCLRHWDNPPHFQVIVLGPDDSESADYRLTEDSLDQQVYPHFTRSRLSQHNWIPQLVSQSASASEHGREWTILLRAGATLSPAALYWVAYLAQRRGIGVVYADHDVTDADGILHDPVFKPDWSAELLRTSNYIGDAFAWRSRPLGNIWDVARATTYSMAGALHSLLLAVTADTPTVAHAHAPLWHIPGTHIAVDATQGQETADIVAAHLTRHEVTATVQATGAGRCHVRYALPGELPLVSIIIPTRDGLHHLRRCIDSLLQKTSYSRYEIIVMDNQSEQPQTLEYLRTIAALPAIRVLPFDEAFNYSKINNYAVEQATGELICLLNNDTEVISPDWLQEMVGLLLQPGTGAVGAKLLYDNDTVQHAGDTVGPGGCANHLHSGIGRDDPGYCGRALVTQDLSAVTAACLLTHKSLYQSLGGLNEQQLTVAFNDVDFCLRVRDAGQRVLWTPHAVLYHHESITRGKDTTPAQIQRARAEVDYMRTRWAHVMHHDPFYNPNLNYQQPDFSLSGMPHVTLPWEHS